MERVTDDEDRDRLRRLSVPVDLKPYSSKLKTSYHTPGSDDPSRSDKHVRTETTGHTLEQNHPESTSNPRTLEIKEETVLSDDEEIQL